jgi:cell division protein FtsL
MMWSPAGPPPALNETVHKLGELLTALATIGLVVVTYLLFKATTLLARSAKEDSRNRKIQATADAWMKLRTELTDLPNLTKLDTAAVKVEGKKRAEEAGELFTSCQFRCLRLRDL